MIDVNKLIKRQKEMEALKKQGKSYSEIGRMYELSYQRIMQILKTDYKKDTEFKVNKFPQLRKLQGRDWVREQVRIRDNYTCKVCGKKWEEGKRRFDVHHKDCDKNKTKKYNKLNEINNSITLCHKCHLNLFKHKESMKIGRLKTS